MKVWVKVSKSEYLRRGDRVKLVGVVKVAKGKPLGHKGYEILKRSVWNEIRKKGFNVKYLDLIPVKTEKAYVPVPSPLYPPRYNYEFRVVCEAEKTADPIMLTVIIVAIAFAIASIVAGSVFWKYLDVYKWAVERGVPPPASPFPTTPEAVAGLGGIVLLIILFLLLARRR